MDMHDRCVVVTGGASGLGPAVRFQCTDVADAGSVAAAVQAAQAHAAHCAQGLGGLVQCAGVAVGRKVLGADGLHPPELFARTLAVNLTGLPQEFAALVLHIFANDYLNGEVIRLDGALRMAPR